MRGDREGAGDLGAVSGRKQGHEGRIVPASLMIGRTEVLSVWPPGTRGHLVSHESFVPDAASDDRVARDVAPGERHVVSEPVTGHPTPNQSRRRFEPGESDAGTCGVTKVGHPPGVHRERAQGRGRKLEGVVGIGFAV